jgi:hypothetical protein
MWATQSLVANLDRSDAVDILKEVLDVCSQQNLSYANIVAPVPNDNFSVGFQIQINASLPNAAINAVEPVLKKHGLSLKKEAERLTIYEPQSTLFRV